MITKKFKSDKANANSTNDQNQPNLSQMTDNSDLEMKNLKQKLEEANNQKLRALADYQNLQTRVEKEKIDFIKFANLKLLLKIIEVKDMIDRAEIFITDPGLKIVSDQISTILKDNGIEEIEVLGKDYDPISMECVDKNECDNNIVVKVSQKAYKLGDRIIRPAQVTVGQIDLKN